ncbi:MAG: hypothetical protein HS132_15995 [Planctomycetia bacterium]|nr:hypothetical protein [Planctomycetia bacterium]
MMHLRLLKELPDVLCWIIGSGKAKLPFPVFGAYYCEFRYIFIVQKRLLDFVQTATFKLLVHCIHKLGQYF